MTHALGDAAKPCVLYIEDDESNRALMTRIAVKHGGVALITASTGTEGIRLARTENPALVLCDGDLPDMTAADVVRSMRTFAETRDLKVIIVTGSMRGHRDLPKENLPRLTKPWKIRDVFDIFDQL